MWKRNKTSKALCKIGILVVQSEELTCYNNIPVRGETMRYFEMQIGKEGALMRGYLHEKSDSWPQFDERPCVVVCPGGGYGFLSDREMDPVTQEWLAQGYQVFLLLYSVADKDVYKRQILPHAAVTAA